MHHLGLAGLLHDQRVGHVGGGVPHLCNSLCVMTASLDILPWSSHRLYPLTMPLVLVLLANLIYLAVVPPLFLCILPPSSQLVVWWLEVDILLPVPGSMLLHLPWPDVDLMLPPDELAGHFEA